jgi:GNAT superfamily N-acetyltransferase
VIEELTPDDLPACLALALDRSWPAEDAKWRLLLEIGTAYGIRDGAGLAGTAILTRFPGDPALAALGMVLVARRCARQGLGRRLVEHVLAGAGSARVTLTATSHGLPLYRGLGFAETGSVVTHTGVPRLPAAPVASRLVVAADLPSIRALDAAVFGADRSAVLDRLPDRTDEFRVLTVNGAVAGFGARWPGGRIGPLVATSDTAARSLLTDLLRDAVTPVRVDVSGPHAALRSWLAAHGLPEAATSPFMSLPPGPLDPRCYSPIMQALG